MRIIKNTSLILLSALVSFSTSLFGNDADICVKGQLTSQVKKITVDETSYCDEYSFLRTAFDTEKIVRLVDSEFLENEIKKFLPEASIDSCSKDHKCLTSFILIYAFHAGDYNNLTVTYKDGVTKSLKRTLTHKSPEPIPLYMKDPSLEASILNSMVSTLTGVVQCSEFKAQKASSDDIDKIRKITANNDTFCSYIDLYTRRISPLYLHGQYTEFFEKEENILKADVASNMLFVDVFDFSNKFLRNDLSMLTWPLVHGLYSTIKVEFEDGKTTELTRDKFLKFWDEVKEKI